MLEKKEIEKYFGTDLLSANILPVFVFAKNQSNDSSFLVTKEQFRLYKILPNIKGGSGQAKLKDSSAGGVVQIAGGVLFTPLLFVGIKMESDYGMIKHNFGVKELKSHTISPGKSTHGFVYFQLPKDKKQQTDSWAVHFKAQNLRKKTMTNFKIPFSWKGK